MSVGVASLVMLATLFAMVIMSFDHCEVHDLGAMIFIFGPTTCALSTYVAWRCVQRSRTESEATSACLSGALLAGGANVPLIALFTGLLTLTHPGHLLVAVIAGCVGGMIVGCPCGFVFGAACLRPIRFGCTRPRSVDGNDLTAQVSWRWLSNLSVVCLAIISAGLALLEGHHGGAKVLVGVLGALFLVGRWFAWRATSRMEARRRWLGQITKEQTSGWTIVSLDEVAQDGVASLPPLFHQDALYSNAVLARRIRSNEAGAYRTGERFIPIALIHDPKDP